MRKWALCQVTGHGLVLALSAPSLPRGRFGSLWAGGTNKWQSEGLGHGLQSWASGEFQGEPQMPKRGLGLIITEAPPWSSGGGWNLFLGWSLGRADACCFCRALISSCTTEFTNLFDWKWQTASAFCGVWVFWLLTSEDTSSVICLECSYLHSCIFSPTSNRTPSLLTYTLH